MEQQAVPVAYWPHLREPRLALKAVVADAAGRALRRRQAPPELLARLGLRQRLRPAALALREALRGQAAVVALAADRTGPRLWS